MLIVWRSRSFSGFGGIGGAGRVVGLVWEGSGRVRRSSVGGGGGFTFGV